MGTGPRAALKRVCSYLPEGQLTNEELADESGWSAEKIEAKTGIRSRCKAADDEFSSDLAIKAGEKLLEATGASRDSIDLILLVTICPDQLVPFTASSIQHALGMPTTTGALDITLACSGYAYALSIAAGLIEAGRIRRAIVFTADRFTPFTAEAEMGSKTLFGDAATASLIEAVDADAPEGGVIGSTRYGTDGAGVEHLIVPTNGLKGFVGAKQQETSVPSLVMDGPEVFDFAIKVVPPFVKGFLADEELEVEDVDHFVFHQANLFMLQHLRRRLRVPEERFVVHLADIGNTNSSTIPIALAHLQDEGRIESGQTLVLVGFGTGYSWSAARLDWA
ncbi:MAG: ketoacyl-ACP synthase III [Planctomycetota bacterium]|jgi:3-oxoacyl-[acyl-carrier-protein] synthase-3